MTAKDVLVKARALIVKKGGHCRTGMYGDDGKVCTVVALSRAAGLNGYAAANRALSVLLKEIDRPCLVAWQDANETPAVLDLFDRAIASLEPAGGAK